MLVTGSESMLMNINSASLNGQGAEKPRSLEKKKKVGRVLYHGGWAGGRVVFQAKIIVVVFLLVVIVVIGREHLGKPSIFIGGQLVFEPNLLVGVHEVGPRGLCRALVGLAHHHGVGSRQLKDRLVFLRHVEQDLLDLGARSAVSPVVQALLQESHELAVGPNDARPPRNRQGCIRTGSSPPRRTTPHRL
jgi:hypothetical protein